MDERVSRLIFLVERKEFLYNLMHADYKNLKKKRKAWAEIAADVEMSVEDCKKKWKWLRNSFNRENSKRNKSGQGIEETETGWKYFSDLHFLKDFITPRLTIRSIPSTSELDDETLDTSPSTSCGYYPTPQKRSKLEPKAFDAELAFTLSPDQDFLECNEEENMDEDELFCASLTKKFKKFPLKHKNEMKIELLNLLNKREEELFCASLTEKLKKFPLNVKNEMKMEILNLLNKKEEELFDH